MTAISHDDSGGWNEAVATRAGVRMVSLAVHAA